MKNIEDLRMIAKTRRIYRVVRDLSLRLLFKSQQTTNPTIIASAKNPSERAIKKKPKMPDSDTLGRLAGVFGLIAAGLVVAAWFAARKENAEKAEAARQQSLEQGRRRIESRCGKIT